MFCMYCGQQLPEGAKFCMKCGTPQGSVSPTGTTQAESINLDGIHTFVPALCPNCSAHMKVDSSAKVAHCDSCGTECLVPDAIKALTVRDNVQVENSTANISCKNIDNLLQEVEDLLAAGNFYGAMLKCDIILESDSTNGKAYFYMLMYSLGCKNRNELAKQHVPFDSNEYYIKAIKYGDSSLKSELSGYINDIKTRNDEERNIRAAEFSRRCAEQKNVINNINCETNTNPLLKRDEIMLADGDFEGEILKCDALQDSDSLLQRVEIMLEDGDFAGAMSECNTILDSYPTNGRVYFYMLLSNLRCKSRNELANQLTPFDGNQYYSKAIQNGDDNLKAELTGYINDIISRNEAKLKNPKVGDIFYFGSYNGQRILWKVLRIQERMALILSFDKICSMPYHKTGDNTTWSDCTLRIFLNKSFINTYFSPVEQSRILPCKLNNVNNPEYETSGGAPTTDKVFLLSINEANSLFANDQARACSWWWLRSPGRLPICAAIVDSSGKVDNSGEVVNNHNVSVRPAMWIKLDP